MGIEVVFVLILPVAAFSLPAAVLLWSRGAKMGGQAGHGPLKACVPLVTALAVSMLGLALYTYIECYSGFTSLVQQGYYTEAERAVYLPRRIVGQAIVELVFVLPAISFVVVPLTTRLIRRGRLTFRGIGQLALIEWFTLSLVGSLFYLGNAPPPYPFSSFLESTMIPVLLYGLPIPVAALLAFRPKIPKSEA